MEASTRAAEVNEGGGAASASSVSVEEELRPQALQPAVAPIKASTTMRRGTGLVYHEAPAEALEHPSWLEGPDSIPMEEMRAVALTCCLFACLAAACSTPGKDPIPITPAPIASQSSSAAPAGQDPATHSKSAECEALRSRIGNAQALPGVPKLQASRAELLGRAKGSPVVFARAPQRDVSGLPAHMRAIIGGLEDPRTALPVLRSLRTMLPHQMKQVRAALLPEGYLYTETPETAEWLVTLFKLEHLFVEPELWLLRGSEIRRLTRTKDGYRYAEGPDQGREASLLIFDRVSEDRNELQPALHADFSPAARDHGFDRVRIEHATAEGWNVGLRFGSADTWVDAVVKVEDGRAQVACELLRAETAAAVHAWRTQAREREAAMTKLRGVVNAQAEENLPFDEPREEVGQQDGSLRPQWAWAYNHGWDGYSFNEIRYPVFDSKGRPHTPQVCIDFVLDTFERASGTWYRERGSAREKTQGRLDFESWQMPNRRGVESVVRSLREHPEAFEVMDVPQEERVRYADRKAFLGYLEAHADDFRSGDVVVIHGPKGAENHYHSFLVFESDPVTGMPILLAGNAGRPRVKSWSSVMQSGPLRSIKHRLRPQLAWMRQVMGDGEVASYAAVGLR